MKTRKILVGIAAVAALLSGIYYFMGEKYKTKEQKTQTVVIPEAPPINELPDLEVLMADQSKINLRDVSGDVMLIFFNPDCEHCQDEAREIAAAKPAFEKWQLYFITSMDAKLAAEFAVNYRLTEPNYHFGHAGVPEVFNSVGALTQVPTILVYKKSRFINKFEGPGTISQVQTLL